MKRRLYKPSLSEDTTRGLYGKGLPSNARSDDGSIPVYGSNGVVGYHNECLVSKPSLIIGRKGSSGAVNLVNQPCWPIDTTYYVIPPYGIDLVFSYYHFKSLNLERFNKATAIPGLNRQDAYSLVVGLPPLEEQKRIVAKVDQLMTLCDELEALHQRRNESRVHLNNAAINKLLDAGSVNEFNELWQLIYKNFDLLYDNLDNVTKLRQTILQLAVMGKLVPQDPNDEPASVLLEKIREEKERLVKEGKIKSFNSFHVVSKDEIRYKLPPNWSYVRLGELLLSLKGGGTPSKRIGAYWNGDIPWASVKDLGKSKYLSSTLDTITSEGLLDSSSNLIPKGNVIVCTRMGLGKIVINNVDVAINQDLKALELSTHVSIDFFYNLYRTLKLRGTGMTVEGIRQEILLNIPVPLPPLEEQKRIVSKVDQLMTLCDELEMRIRKSQEDGEKITNAVVSNLTAM